MSWPLHDNYGTDILQAKLHILVKNDIKSIVSITLFNYLPTKINQGFIKCFLSLGDTLLGVLLLMIFFILNLCWIDWCGRKVEYVHRFTYQFLKHNHITRSLGGICASRAQLYIDLLTRTWNIIMEQEFFEACLVLIKKSNFLKNF